MDQPAIFETTESPRPPERHDQGARQHLADQLHGMGVKLDTASFERAYARVRRNGTQASPSQLSAIVEDVLSGTEVLEGVAESFR